MASSQIKIEGLDKLRKALRDLPQNVQKNVLAKAVSAGADVILAEAQAKAPVLGEATPHRTPGTVRNSLYATRGKRDDSSASAFVGIRRLAGRALAAFKRRTGSAAAMNPSDPFYWKFLEFGTAKMRARPFIRPAFDARKEDAAKAITEALRKGVEEEAAKLSWRL